MPRSFPPPPDTCAAPLAVSPQRATGARPPERGAVRASSRCPTGGHAGHTAPASPELSRKEGILPCHFELTRKRTRFEH
jgi:hypothetical protein